MKYFIAIVLIAAVASAAVRPTPVSAEIAEIQEIIAAIQSPSTHPATAAALEQMLLDALGIKPEPIAVGPAIVENPLEGIAVGPALIDFPLPDGGAVSAPVVAPSPVAIVEGPAADVSASAPLVQIILNINQAAQSSPVAVGPVVTPEPVQVVEDGPLAPVRPVPIATLPLPVEEIAPPAPVRPVPIPTIPVVEVAPEPVQVVEVAPVPVEPVQIGVPVLPEAAVILPDQLN